MPAQVRRYGVANPSGDERAEDGDHDHVLQRDADRRDTCPRGYPPPPRSRGAIQVGETAGD